MVLVNPSSPSWVTGVELTGGARLPDLATKSHAAPGGDVSDPAVVAATANSSTIDPSTIIDASRYLDGNGVLHAVEAWPQLWVENLTVKTGERVTFGASHHYNVTVPLLDSGLLGPVTATEAALENLDGFGLWEILEPRWTGPFHKMMVVSATGNDYLSKSYYFYSSIGASTARNLITSYNRHLNTI